MKKFFAFLLVFGMALGLAAHEGEGKKKAGAAAKSAVAGLTKAAAVAGTEMAEGAKAAEAIDFRPIFSEAMKSHHHNRLVHFPVAIGLVAVLFALYAYREEKFKTPSQWLFFLAALGSVAAYLTGEGAEEALDQMSPALEQAVELHESQGLIVMLMLWLSWALSFGSWARKWAWIVFLATGFFISGAGMFGGIIAHMGL